MKVKILIYDIETTPNTAYVWGKYDQDVIAYEKEKELLSFAYSWYGSDSITCITRANQKTDKHLVKQLADLLQKADITVAHNGDNFDRKIVKARMIYHGMKPLKHACSVDTLKAARTYFKFNGNSLNDLVKFLNIGEKVQTQGIDLWLGCMKDKPSSWDKMVKYNKRDVELLTELYRRMRPWIESHPNVYRLLNPNSKDPACPLCSSKNFMKNGYRPSIVGLRQRLICRDCGRYWLSTVSKAPK